MPVIATIDPVSRIEGHLKIEVTVDTVDGVQKVVDARATGTMFRGFETILVNRDPRDAQHFTQRICGVCPVSHGLAAVEALDIAFGVTPPNNARVLRNLVLGANYIQSHILHFYHLAAIDFLDGPNMPPWQPSWNVDKRIDEATTGVLVGHYLTALEMRRKAHEMGALFGGRLPHPPTYIPGGFTTTVRSERITAFRNYLNELISFINNIYIPDVLALASIYNDYFQIGKGHGHLLAYGVFDLDQAGTNKLLKRGQITNSSTTVNPVDINAITEDVTHSWYADKTTGLNPAQGETIPQHPKKNGYSWLKSPRYSNMAYELGPLARMWVNGDYQNGISVMDRHKSRALETIKVAQAMLVWLDQLVVDGPVYQKCTVPNSGSGVGLTEAARGALGHWLQVSNGKISRYQVITPTCWNASPRDDSGVRGPIEESLIGTPVQDVNQAVEVVRVIHSFDPCVSCAVHVMRPKEDAKIFAINHYHGEEEIYTHTHDGHTHSHAHEHPHEH